MKKILLALAFCVLTIGIHAQNNYAPDIKKGAKLRYSIATEGQHLPLIISVDSIAPGYLKLGWNIEGMGTGGWIMTQNSLDKAVRGWWSEPLAGSDVTLADDQNVLVVSKAIWDALHRDKKADYDLQTFTLKTPTDQQRLLIDGKPLNVLMLEGQNGTSKIWLLNNPKFPAIVKIEGNTMGPDITLIGIE